jgi:guanylate kinase
MSVAIDDHDDLNATNADPDRSRSSSETPASGLLLVVSGPSGVGKTTIVHRLQTHFDGVFSVSATTRPRTDQEVEGRDYHFVSDDAFQSMVDRGEFLEHATVFGRYRYGTPRGPVEAQLRTGRLIILDIDVQGALQVRRSMPDALLMFIMPPSDEELLRRLRARGREDEVVIQRRFAESRQEIELARSSGAFDMLVVNDDLDRAVSDAAAEILRRRSRTTNEQGG